MQYRPLTTNDSRTLLVDAHSRQGEQLVDRLGRAGFRTDFAVSASAARGALAANFYHACIFVAGVDRAADLEQLAALRRAAPRVWIIALSELAPEDAPTLLDWPGADAVLTTPFSLQDLASRLAAFSLRSRPTF